MRNNWYKKGLVVGIIVLPIIATIVTFVILHLGQIEKKKNFS
jgi:hypothetical protein